MIMEDLDTQPETIGTEEQKAELEKEEDWNIKGIMDKGE